MDPVHKLPLLGTFVVGADRTPLAVWIDDEYLNPVNLTGGSGAAVLQGRSADVPLVTLNGACTITDGGNGLVTVYPGALVSAANMTTAGKMRAAFACRIKYTDNAGKIDWTKWFRLAFVQTPTLYLP